MKPPKLNHVVPAAVFFLLLPTLPLGGSAQELQAGRVMEATTSDAEAAVFTFEAESAGVLTVVVRSTDGTDLVLLVTDGNGQPLPDARSDQDLGGDSGAEQLAVTLPRAGQYQVRVEPFQGFDSFGFGTSTFPFLIGASWLPFPEVEPAPDPDGDGAPATATPLPPEQQSLEDSIDEEKGDRWDWYVIVPDRAGILTVVLRAEEGDLVLEAYQEDAFDEWWERSDQDLQGVNGNEALTLLVNPGEPVYFKVSAYGSAGGIGYRLQVLFVPD